MTAARCWARPCSATPSVTILTDPDVVNNHGLDEGKNARFAVGLIDELRAGGPVVFDEIAHGYTLEPSIWKLMFQWPLVLATLQALICILILVAATAGRFGPAASAGRPYAAGKDFLIRNTAALLRYGGHDGEALRRYLTSTVHSVRVALHAPRDLNAAAMTAWLERIRVARNGTVPLPDLERDVVTAATDPAFAKRIPDIAMRNPPLASGDDSWISPPSITPPITSAARSTRSSSVRTTRSI